MEQHTPFHATSYFTILLVVIFEQVTQDTPYYTEHIDSAHPSLFRVEFQQGGKNQLLFPCPQHSDNHPHIAGTVVLIENRPPCRADDSRRHDLSIGVLPPFAV